MAETRRDGAIVNAKAWLSGKAPTRDEVLAELGRELRRRREAFPKQVEAGNLAQVDADVRIDRLQAAHDYVMAHWPRNRQELHA